MSETIGYNNVLNIRYSPLNRWLGLDADKPSNRGFCNFTSVWYCFRAAYIMLFRTYPKRINPSSPDSVTLRQLLTRYAPPSENLTDAYVSNASKMIHLDADAPFPFYSYHLKCSLLSVMACIESNSAFSVDEIKTAILIYSHF